jgi:hypothetical protein
MFSCFLLKLYNLLKQETTIVFLKYWNLPCRGLQAGMEEDESTPTKDLSSPNSPEAWWK